MNNKMSKSIELLFDYVSPYAYLAWTQLPRLSERFGVTVEPVPVLFAGLLNAHDNTGPAEIPAKHRWMIDNVLQTARMLGVPIRPPSFHPFNPLAALRVTASCENRGEQVSIINACFEAVWRDAVHIEEPRVLKSILAGAGVDAAAAMERATTKTAKDLLRQNTDSAIAAGVFGVPTFLLDEQLYWGVNDLALIEARLNGEQLLDKGASTLWRTRVRPSAQRRRSKCKS